MQSLLIIAAVFIGCYAIIWIKNHRHNFAASLRTLCKRCARCVMSFSWVIGVAAILLIACYPNVSGLLKEILSAQSVRDVKSLTRLIFGVDSSFVALQMLAMYSIITSLVSCLLLSVGVIVRVVFVTTFKAAGSIPADIQDGRCFEDFTPHVTPSFKLFSRYNS